jgi:hypothetical protein
VPSFVAPGTYELRLFANDGYTSLATSNSFTVTGGATLTASSDGGAWQRNYGSLEWEGAGENNTCSF